MELKRSLRDFYFPQSVGKKYEELLKKLPRRAEDSAEQRSELALGSQQQIPLKPTPQEKVPNKGGLTIN